MADIDISLGTPESVTLTESVTAEISSLTISVSDLVTLSESKELFFPTLVFSASDTVRVRDNAFSVVSIYELSEELIDVPDLDRIYLLEFKVGREVELETWSAAGSGAFSCSFNPAEFGEVLYIEVDSAVYTRASGVAACQTYESSFYFDYSNKLLYVHLPSGVAPDTLDEDGVPVYCIIAYFWVCITNRQPEENRTIYTPAPEFGQPGATHPVYYLPYLNSDRMPAIEQSVGDYYKADLRIQFGTVTFVNDGWWYKAFEYMIWHNAKVYIKVGVKGEAYETFSTVLIGTARNPKVSDEEASLDISDSRSSTMAEIPITFFPLVNEDPDPEAPPVTPDIPKYYYMEPSASGRPIPIPFGYCRGIIPVCLDPAEYIFKVSDYEVEEIMAVYENDVKLYPPVLHEGETAADFLPATGPEYTVDEANGEFSLLQDYEDHVIKCDVKGIKCSPSNEYSDNFADVCLFILKTLNHLPESEIDLVAFNDLRTERTQKVGFYLDSLTDSLEVFRMLQASGVFQMFPDLTGRWTVKLYDYTAPTDLVIRKEDIIGLGIEYDTEGIYWQVQVKYRKDCATGEFLTTGASDDRVRHRYRESKILEVQTYLCEVADAVGLAQFYLNLVKMPPKSIRGNIGIEGFGRTPADKVSISKSIVDGEGNTIAILTNAVYRILEFNKELGPSQTGIVGLDDSISTGNVHIDTAVYTDHGDAYTDIDHVNVPHSNVAHEDIAHENVEHSDAHSDLYNDYWAGRYSTIEPPYYRNHLDHYDTVIHSDAGHWDYGDLGKPSNPAYSDYEDAHGDIHLDLNYADESYEYVYLWHTDTHSNVPHTDTHLDIHGDTEHADSPEVSIHTQTHSDIPHGDAHY